MVHDPWTREPYAPKAVDRRLAGIAQVHAQRSFAARADPGESALYSVLIERVHEQENGS
ncbi:MAG TPA: hypothetical protein HA256_03600 [Methanoregulaceae archaeon]|nr:hypothetical protein [Methanoregulaceae archaeon]